MAPLCLPTGGEIEAADLIGQPKGENEAWDTHFLLLPLPSQVEVGRDHLLLLSPIICTLSGLQSGRKERCWVCSSCANISPSAAPVALIVRLAGMTPGSSQGSSSINAFLPD